MTQSVIVKCRIYYNEMLGVLVVLSCVLALATAGQSSPINYCGAKMCKNTNAHTLCQYPKGASPKCNSYMKSRLRTYEKKNILDRLNVLRSLAAQGAMFPFPPAQDMLKLHWIEALAHEAQRWADQCRPPQSVEEHDTCRDLYSLKVGQCVASVVGTTPVRVEQMVDIWNIQGIFYNYTVDYYVPPRNGSAYYGDFAQMLWSGSYMVGCGLSRFMAQWKGRMQRVQRLVCNVAPYGPQATQAIWTPGSPASHCPHKAMPNLKGNGLCVYPESRRAVEKALERRERDLSRAKRKKKTRKPPKSGKVRRDLPEVSDYDYGDEGKPRPTRQNKMVLTTTAKSVHPIMSLIKLIPSMADYPANFPKELMDNAASYLSPSLLTILVLFL
ncbi:venom allergen 5-like [Spodoptera frugiperda]|uniref:Venom allergen 5-like n=1 Tax=Spodoptera frugiperda TaxID=7108 RepID=A0A9R0F4N3_SPOFR|nr:venom allergen 5-like [Spodoptera frugiperda]